MGGRDTGAKLLLLGRNLEREEGLGNGGTWGHLFPHPSQKAQMHYFHVRTLRGRAAARSRR